METVWQDARYSARNLRKSPGFTAVAVLTLSLGIGANSAMFSVVNGILLRSLPFKEPSRLVTVLDTKPSKGVDWLFVSPNRFEECVRRNSAFDQIAAAENCFFKLEKHGAPILLQGGCATASFFPMLGVQPFLGRLFTPEEDRPGGNPVAVLSYGCWKEKFGGDPAAVGKTIRRTATMRNSLSSVCFQRTSSQRLRGKIAFRELPNGIDDRQLANPAPCGIH